MQRLTRPSRAHAERHVRLTRPYGPLIRSVELPIESGVIITHVQHPFAMMYRACQCGGAFPVVLRETHAQRPSSSDAPWNFVFYYDGIGMKLLESDARHVEACYWSIAEFGRPTLNCEEGWFVFGAPRQSLIEELPGGLSHYAAILLRLIFGNGLEYDAHKSGLFFRSGMVVSR